MGLFSSGGKGNSASQTASTTTTNTTNTQETLNTVDNRAVQGDGAAIGGNVTLTGISGGSVNVSTTDQGAVQAGLDLALESLSTVQNLATVNASVASDSISQAYSLANQARQSETSGAIQTTLKYGAIVAGLALIAWAYVRSK